VTNAKVIRDIARPRGAFPHVRRAGEFYFVSGTSARRADDTITGVTRAADGSPIRDIREQTRAVIRTIETILASVECTLADLVSITTFLTSMDEFAAYNEVYAEFFSYDGPTRTTVAVRELPHPDLLIEMQAVAHRPQDAL